MLNFDHFSLPSNSKYLLFYLYFNGLLIQTGRPAGWPIWLAGARRRPHAAQWGFSVRFRRVELYRNGIPGGPKPSAVSLGPGPGTGPGMALQLPRTADSPPRRRCCSIPQPASELLLLIKKYWH